MRRRAFSVAGLLLLLPLAVSLGFQETNPIPQGEEAKRQSTDYMNTLLLRNTKPLGLKEDLAQRRLTRQPNINWAIRATARHILD